jgi:hypothetical protein
MAGRYRRFSVDALPEDAVDDERLESFAIKPDDLRK